MSPHMTLQKLALPRTCALAASQHGVEPRFCSPVTLSKPSLSAFLPQFPPRDQHSHLSELKVRCSSMALRLLRQVKNMKKKSQDVEQGRLRAEATPSEVGLCGRGVARGSRLSAVPLPP